MEPNENGEDDKKKISIKKDSLSEHLDSPLLNGMHDSTDSNHDTSQLYDVTTLISQTQKRLWKALKRRYKYSSTLDPAQNYLRKYANSKICLAVLYVDLVGSTNLCMTISVDKLATIIRAFTYEMSSVIQSYGGFVLKYVGDAVISFFPSASNKYLACETAVKCGTSQLSVIRNGLNPILNQYDYPELSAKIGIDEGENAVVQYNTDKNSPLDILGYCMSVSAKMTSLTEPNKITIGDDVYNVLRPELQERFVQVSYSEKEWKYVSKRTGQLYKLHTLTM
ncbi:MAG: adenylate/guanylate cyclase domain-containing protein [Thermoproteota archaeon]|nr:adenylate/guanylate cyclase domain-containing protein [Thermoproteota archaeon]